MRKRMMRVTHEKERRPPAVALFRAYDAGRRHREEDPRGNPPRSGGCPLASKTPHAQRASAARRAVRGSMLAVAVILCLNHAFWVLFLFIFQVFAISILCLNIFGGRERRCIYAHIEQRCIRAGIERRCMTVTL